MEETAYRGAGAFAAFAGFDVEECRDAGERVVVIGQLLARARATDADVEARVACLFEFRGGLLSRGRNYLDIAEALHVAGVST